MNPREPDSESFRRWADLVETTLKKEFARYRDVTTLENRADFDSLREGIFSGLFFDCLELHLRILKERIREEG